MCSSDLYIGDEGARALAEALQHNTSLQKLTLICIYIGDEGARAFADALQTNTSLLELELNPNNFGLDERQVLSVIHNLLDHNRRRPNLMDRLRNVLELHVRPEIAGLLSDRYVAT